MWKGLQDSVNLLLPFLHFLGEVPILEECVEGVVLEVGLGGCTCCLRLLLGSVGVLLESDLSTIAVFSCGGALGGAFEVVVRWPQFRP